MTAQLMQVPAPVPVARGSRHPSVLLAAAVAVAGLAVAPATARAGKADVQVNRVVRGSAQVQRAGDAVTIRAADRTIIDFRKFDVAAGGSVTFVQPGSKSRVLNRITGGSPSLIDGRIDANGRVYFVNPAGIVFGPNGVVNAGHFIAAAGHITDGDFVRGTDRFRTTGNVTNQGTIRADSVSLVGREVANAGHIDAPKGVVAMAAGDHVLIGKRNGNVFLKVDPAAPAAATKGSIYGSGDLFSYAVRHTGTTKAKQAVLQAAGPGSTVTASGKIDASNTVPGGKGGRVDLLGEKVQTAALTIDASGAAGGGKVHVGGNYQGKGPLPNAKTTTVSADTTIRADVLTNGKGGEVIVWSDVTTRFAGHISVRGGLAGGDGGFVEVSGKENLQFKGTADLTSPTAAAGQLLLDPKRIVISSTDGSDNGLLTDDDREVRSEDGIPEGIDEFNFSVQHIVSLLESGDLFLQASEQIILNADIVVTTSQANGLKLQAPVIQSDGRDLKISAVGNVEIQGSIDTRKTDGSGVGDLDISGRNVVIRGNVTTAGGQPGPGSQQFVSGGTVTLKATSGNVTAAERIDTVGGQSVETTSLIDASGFLQSGSVIVSAPAGSVSVGEIRANGDFEGGEISLKPSVALREGIPSGILLLNGNLSAIGPGGQIVLAGDHSQPLLVANIVARPNVSAASQSISIVAGESIMQGQHARMFILPRSQLTKGTLSARFQASRISVYDVFAVGALTLAADNLEVFGRAPTLVGTSRFSQREDTGNRILAASGALTFSGHLNDSPRADLKPIPPEELIFAQKEPIFAGKELVGNAPQIDSGLSAEVRETLTPLTLKSGKFDSVLVGTQTYYFPGEIVTDPGLASALAGALPSEIPTPAPQVPVSSTEADLLKLVGVYAKPPVPSAVAGGAAPAASVPPADQTQPRSTALSREQVARYQQGYAIYMDIPEVQVTRGPEKTSELRRLPIYTSKHIEVSPGRLHRPNVLAALDAYRVAFHPDLPPDADQNALSAEPKQRLAAFKTAMANALPRWKPELAGEADVGPADLDPVAFRAWVETDDADPSPEDKATRTAVREELAKLDNLVARVHDLGLSPAERQGALGILFALFEQKSPEDEVYKKPYKVMTDKNWLRVVEAKKDVDEAAAADRKSAPRPAAGPVAAK